MSVAINQKEVNVEIKKIMDKPTNNLCRDFVLCDGSKLRNPKDLLRALKNMSDDIFDHHVTHDRNDFGVWIYHCFDKHLGNSIKRNLSKEELTDALKKYFSNNGIIYETIIIGAGIAGISAAIYASRKRMEFLLISADFAGQMNYAGDIENYPGFNRISSSEFSKTLEQQVKHNHIDVNYERVESISKEDYLFLVKTNKYEYKTETIVFTSGASARKLGIAREEEFAGKGISYCGICDAPLFKKKPVAIIGGGSAALEAADFLLRIASKIYIINITSELGGHEYLRERIVNQDKVELFNSSEVTEIIGHNNVTGIKFRTINKDKKGNKNKKPEGAKETELKVEGIFIEIGRTPNTDIMKGLVDIDSHGHVIVDKQMAASCPGVFAAGDCADVHSYQFVIAAGQGVTALLNAAQFVGKKW